MRMMRVSERRVRAGGPETLDMKDKLGVSQPDLRGAKRQGEREGEGDGTGSKGGQVCRGCKEHGE